MKVQLYTGHAMAQPCEHGVPLWQRAPTRDSEGARLTDFMMLIPQLSRRPAGEIESVSRIIRTVLGLHKEVVFADLNLKLNLLWVSLRPRHGAILEIAGAIRTLVPRAILVAHPSEARAR